MKILLRLKYVILFILISGIYMVKRILIEDEYAYCIRYGMIFVILGVIIWNVVIIKQKKWSIHYLYGSILVVGCVMRIGYMLYTECKIRAHDIGGFSKESIGHASYILRMIQDKKLPDSYTGQFYQQPFFYMIGSFVSVIINRILNCQADYYYVDATKVISCFASCSTLLIIPRICDELNICKKGKIIATVIVAFTPVFYLIGGRVTCDSLAVFFMTMAILYTIRWMKETSLKNTIILAFIYGFGIMTKISVGIIAISTAGVFLYKFMKAIREKKTVEYLVKYVVFMCISFPIGLWYSIRNYQLFGQPFGYVLKMGIDAEPYCGNHSIIERFFSVSFGNLLKTPYAFPNEDYNLPVYLLKTSLFGEFTYNITKLIPILLLIAGIILVVIKIYSSIVEGKKIVMKQETSEMVFITITGAILLLSIVWFYFKYPFACSMDFRYYGAIAIVGAIMTARLFETKKNVKIEKFIIMTVVLYTSMSCLMYVMI